MRGVARNGLPVFIAVAAVCLPFSLALCWSVDADVPSPSEGDIIFYVDIATFYDGPGRNIEEIYCVVPNEQIRFVAVGKDKAGALAGRLRYAVEVIDTTGKVIESTEKTVAVSAPSAEDAVDRTVVQVLQSRVSVAPGRYTIGVTIDDLNARKRTLLSYILRRHRRGRVEVAVDSKEFRDGEIAISDIEFARSVRRTSEGDFQKSGYEIVPNAQRRFGRLLPEMSLYFEVYNLKGDVAADSILAAYSILTRDGSTIFSNEMPMAVRGSRFGATAVFDVTSLTGGSYLLDLTIRDRSGAVLADSRRAFDVVWSVLSWGKYEIERIEDMAFVFTEVEMEEFKSLSAGEQEKFMVDFWKRIDPTPATHDNEAMIEHYRRIAYADEHYGTAGLRGALTDRGKIYIKYGAPDDVQSFFSDYEFIRDKRDMEGGGEPIPTDPFARVGIKAGTDAGTGGASGAQADAYSDQRGGSTVHGKPYETWTYDGPGDPVRRLSDRVASSATMRFMFVDDRGIGDFKMIYSSEKQEY